MWLVIFARGLSSRVCRESRAICKKGSRKWTPVVVNHTGHESEFKVVDLEGIPKNISFQLFRETSYSYL